MKLRINLSATNIIFGKIKEKNCEQYFLSHEQGWNLEDEYQGGVLILGWSQNLRLLIFLLLPLKYSLYRKKITCTKFQLLKLIRPLSPWSLTQELHKNGKRPILHFHRYLCRPFFIHDLKLSFITYQRSSIMAHLTWIFKENSISAFPESWRGSRSRAEGQRP